MNKLTVALTTNCVNNIGLLPPKFVTTDGRHEITFHSDPQAQLVNHWPVCNFDYHIDLTVEPNRDAQTIYPDRYFPMLRNSKTDQSLQIRRIAHRHDLPLHQPVVYGGLMNLQTKVPVSLYGVLVSVRVVVKRENGARGCGQAVVPRAQLNDFLACLNLQTKDLKQRFPDVLFSPIYTADGVVTAKDEEGPYFQGDAIHVCEYIDNIVEEARVLVGGDKILIRKRELSDGPYRQANLDVTGAIVGEPVTYVTLEEYFNDPTTVAIIKTLVKELKLYYGSIDLYVLNDGRLGVFEYCHQFGFKNTDPVLIRELGQLFVEKVLLEAGLITDIGPEPKPKPVTQVTRFNYYDTGLTKDEVVASVRKRVLSGTLLGEIGEPVPDWSSERWNTVDIHNVGIKVLSTDLDENDFTVKWVPYGPMSPVAKEVIERAGGRLKPRINADKRALVTFDLVPAI